MTKTRDLADLGGGFIQAGTGAVQRTVESKLQDVVSVKDFGAVGDGVTDDRAAIAAAAAASSEIYFPVGTYKINTSVSIGSTVVFADGAVLKPASGQTVTLSKAIKANRHKIFDTSLGGSFAVTRRESVGYPEWFGAVIDSSANAATNLAAISSTLDVFAECNLAGGDYFISDSLRITSSFKRLQGHFFGIGGNSKIGQTRLVVNSNTADCVKVYTEGLPDDRTLWISDVTIRDIQLARNSAPIMSATAIGSCAALRIECAKWIQTERVWCADHIIGVLTRKTVRVYLRSTHVLRVSSGAAGAVPMHCIGFWLDGTERISGFVSNNASMYLFDCSVTVNSGLDVLDDTQSTVSIAMFTEGTISDLFVEDFEVARCKVGISINMATLSDSDTIRKGAQDVHFRNIVLDIISKQGVVIANMPRFSNTIRFDGGYIHMLANTGGFAPTCFTVNSSYARIFVHQVQMIGRATDSTGIDLQTGRNCTFRDCLLLDCEKPYVQLGGSDTLFDSAIANTTERPATQFAMELTNASRTILRPFIDGDSAVFPGGVKFLGYPQGGQVDTTGILSTAISGGTANILNWAGTAITGNDTGYQTAAITGGTARLVHQGMVI